MLELVGHLIRRRIIDDMLYVAPTLQNQSLQSFFGQFLSRPTSTDARSDDDRIVTTLLYAVYVRICHLAWLL